MRYILYFDIFTINVQFKDKKTEKLVSFVFR